MRNTYLCKLAWRILSRSWRATIVLSSMVVLAVAALVFILALAVGTSDAMIRNSTGLYAGHILATGLSAKDAKALQAQQKQIDGVKQVLVRQHLPVVLRSAKGMEAVDLIGVYPLQEKRAAAYWKKTVEGIYLKQGADTIFLSEAMMKRLRLNVGDAVSLLNPEGQRLKQLKISGAYKTGVSVLDGGIAFSPVEALPDGASVYAAAIFLKEGAPLQSIVAQYRNALPKATFTPWTTFMPDLKQLIDMNDFCMKILIVLVFAIVGVGVACIFLIFILKNLREHGIMKAMGFTARDTTLLLLVQIGLLTFIAAALGTLVGALVAWGFSRTGIDISAYISHNPYFAVSGVLYPRLTGLSLGAPPLVAVCFSLIAAVWPITDVLRRSPADILRSV